MNDNEKAKWDELRESWIESLLVSAAGQSAHTDRIARAMSQIEPGPAQPSLSRQVRRRQWILRGGLIAIAASLLSLLFFLRGGGDSTAMAAIQRSLDVASDQTTRKYLAEVDYRSPIGTSLRIAYELYVQGSERFVLRQPGLLPGNGFWLGRDGSEAWVVPPVGPVMKGDLTLHRLWLRPREDLGTPYLHVTTMLKRMSSGYRLRTLDDETVLIPDGKSVTCQHIRAQLKTFDEKDLPDTIELWASRESGMSIQVVARWELTNSEVGRKSIVLTFQSEEPQLSRDWFTPEAHASAR